MSSFQNNAKEWINTAFGPEVANDKTERNHRFLEESLELVQACGCTKEEALQLVDYVFNRPIGEVKQEVGGTAVTLALLCEAHGIDMIEAGEIEIKNIWNKIDKIREKRAKKPDFSPLPQ